MKDSEDPLNNSIIHYIIEKAADREYSITKTMFDQVCIDLDFNTQNKNGESPLHLSCRSLINSKDDAQKLKFTEISKYLVMRQKADINLKNNIGDSPLTIA